MLTRVAFYRDEQYQDPVAIYRGRARSGNNQFQPIIVPGDTVYFRFTSGPIATFWGYKFTVTPLEWRLNDVQALKGLNFELGYWFLELLLEEGPSFVKDVYIVDLYDALVWYIRAAKRSAKGRGMQLLLRVLREIKTSSTSAKKVNLRKVLGLRRKMDIIYSKENTNANTQLLHSSHLQSLVELVAVARLVEHEIYKSSELQGEKEIEKSEKIKEVEGKGKEKVKEGEHQDDKQVSLLDIGVPKLRITKATYGILDDKSKCKDLTVEIQGIVENYGGGYLFLPSNHQTALELFAHAFGKPEPKKDEGEATTPTPTPTPTTPATTTTQPVIDPPRRRPVSFFGGGDEDEDNSGGLRFSGEGGAV